MIIAPIALLCAGWFLICWFMMKIVAKIVGGNNFIVRFALGGAKMLWVLVAVVGVVAAFKGV